MDLFYAASDLVIARAGGAVAELTATGTPAVLVPGRFGSSGHQSGNARRLERAGAAVVIEEEDLGALASLVDRVLFDPSRLEAMTTAAVSIAKPDAALTIARAMIEAAP
jgi:UDP-N-acetylglucosamine--N-acetylmuramyl-(pentapeptide) pyrophosphoryl-undecaprenol N-acetylglucosamine transferase